MIYLPRSSLLITTHRSYLKASDFDAGAMENWGLITGRTSAFLLDPAKADLSAKQRVAEVQSHEVAHMW
jgi:aminopeptidase 2